jgi:hypothetical protein
MPELYELGLSGATRGIVEEFISSHKLIFDLSRASSLDMVKISAGDVEIDVSGASSATGSLTASGDAQFTLSGASTLETEGEANNLFIGEASGGSNLELSNYLTYNANMNFSGASQATINLDGRLDADLNGVSRLYYIGEPTMGDINTIGDSTISKK